MLALVAVVALDLVLPAPTPPPAADGAWRVVKIVDGVTLKEAASPRPKAPWGLGEAEIAAPLDTVIAHLLDFPSLTRFMPRLEKVQVLETREGEALVYFRFDLPWPISDRDWTARYAWTREPARFRMIWFDDNGRGPPPHRTVRVAPVRGAWELVATSSGTTLARYLFLAEFGGWLPRSVIEETVWKEPLQTLRGVRAALETKKK